MNQSALVVYFNFLFHVKTNPFRKVPRICIDYFGTIWIDYLLTISLVLSFILDSITGY